MFRVDPRVRLTVWLGVIFNSILYGSMIGIAIYEMLPHLDEQWNSAVANAQGKYFNIPFICIGIFAVIIDLYIFVLPIALIANLRLRFQKKVF